MGNSRDKSLPKPPPKHLFAECYKQRCEHQHFGLAQRDRPCNRGVHVAPHQLKPAPTPVEISVVFLPRPRSSEVNGLAPAEGPGQKIHSQIQSRGWVWSPPCSMAPISKVASLECRTTGPFALHWQREKTFSGSCIRNQNSQQGCCIFYQINQIFAKKK